MIEEVRKDDMCFGFVIGWAVDKFAGFAISPATTPQTPRLQPPCSA